MSNALTIGELIKRYIKMRGRTVKEVATDLKRNYKTFCGILNRDVVDAKLLFELANLLDIDLIWMSQLFDMRKPISSLAPYQMSRMQDDMRRHDTPDVLKQLDYCIANNPDSITEVRKELMSIYPSLFYILDILLPEDTVIRISIERGKEKYFCIPIDQSGATLTRMRGRSTYNIYDGIEMLNLLIAKRKEEKR